MVVDSEGFRKNVGVIITDGSGHVFIGRRIGHDTWQFPQGGVHEGESAEDTMYRELHEEVGLDRQDVEILGVTQDWIPYRLPKQYTRRNTTHSIVGQKQKWFLLRLVCSEQKIRLDLSDSPEFDSWRWVDYWHPVREVIYFKRQVYRLALNELEPFLPK